MKHLSSEQISSVAAGIRIPEDAHVQLCAECAEEVERIQNVLTLFRGSVREWTDRLDHSEFPAREAIDLLERGNRAPHRVGMAWVLATAALAAAVAIPMYQNSRDQELKAQAVRDAQLLEDVNAQLSRSGPLAMDPLMQLMFVPDGASAPGSSKSRGNETETKQENGGIQ